MNDPVCFPSHSDYHVQLKCQLAISNVIFEVKMQLKSLQKSRYCQLWEDEHNLIESVIKKCIIEHKIIEDGTLLLTQGKCISSLILVESGLVSMGYTARNGRSFQLGTMNCDNQIFGEMEFFTDYPCQMDIKAKEALTISVISFEKLHQAMIEHPTIALFFASAIAIDYQDTIDIFLRRMLHTIVYNVAHDLYHQLLDDQPVSGFNKGYLEAERFGTTDRVYRRALKNLEELGLIRKDKNIIHIDNIEKLKLYVERGE